MKQSLKQRILAYYKRQKGVWIAGAKIERLTAQTGKYKASNASRRLRELAEDGELSTKLVRGHVYYCYDKTETKTIQVPPDTSGARTSIRLESKIIEV